jgi:hypothetical protein
MSMLQVRVYYANQLVVIWHVHPREVLKFDPLETEIYNGGYIKYPEGHQLYPSGWARCDGTPVLLEDVPKELRVLELLNST